MNFFKKKFLFLSKPKRGLIPFLCRFDQSIRHHTDVELADQTLGFFRGSRVFPLWTRMPHRQRGGGDQGHETGPVEVTGIGGECLVRVQRSSRQWLKMQGDAGRSGLLHQQHTHISNFGITSESLPPIMFSEDWFDLQCFYTHPPHAVRFFLARDCFGDFLSCPAMRGDFAYVMDLVERFRSETMTFHMSVAKMTITPIDWSMIIWRS